jgi:hypothetical protein
MRATFLNNLHILFYFLEVVGPVVVFYRYGMPKKINIYTIYWFGSVCPLDLKTGTKNRTKPLRFLVGSVQFFIQTIKIGFFRFGLV